MVECFIDESGSMTKENAKDFPYFVICIVVPKNKERLKTRFKRFISNNYMELQGIDRAKKMFIDGKFHELKGSSLTKEMKVKFANYICQFNLFEVYYIKVINKYIDDILYSNKARAFNYFIGLSLQHNLKNKNLPSDVYNLNIDERNVKTQSQNTLEDYLNIKLSIEYKYIKSLKVKYFDSANNIIVQISDFFSNLYYSNLITEGKYNNLFEQLESQKIIMDYIEFPITKKKVY